MRAFIALLAAIVVCQAKPQRGGAGPSVFMGGDQYIVGGSEADQGEFPWQLSQTRGGSHSCGASLLSANSGLSAAHCVDGALVGSLSVIAGLHSRSDPDSTNAQETDLDDYTMHEDYNTGIYAFSNDVAILHFSTAIQVGGNIQLLTLPPDNSNDFNGVTCVISGWGRVGSSNVLPDTLQKASIEVIDTATCDGLMSNVIGARVWDNHICLYDTANNIGSCNGDSGGPLNCPLGGSTVVAGITSWGVSSGGDCLQTYPSVYTRTSAYLDWINSNGKK